MTEKVTRHGSVVAGPQLLHSGPLEGSRRMLEIQEIGRAAPGVGDIILRLGFCAECKGKGAEPRHSSLSLLPDC